MRSRVASVETERQGMPKRRTWMAGRDHISRFRDDEGGGMLILGIYFFFLMLAFAGIAVDVMRQESLRTQLQNTVDRASLAAASLNQTLPPEDVVADYFAKAGLTEYLISTNADSGLNYKTVSIKTGTDLPTFFMSMMGINTLPTIANGTAEERVSNVEISLVLDISGSMNSYSRLTNLKAAAKEFTDSVMGASEEGLVSISIIPYSGQVNIGPDLFGQFNATEDHTYSYCVELPSTAFSSVSLSTTAPLKQSSPFDPYAYADTSSDSAASLFFCPPQTGNRVLPFGHDAATIKARIDGLVAGGNTAIDIGLKWGALLLDDTAQDIVGNLVDSGVIHQDFDGRPLNPDDDDVLKILVLMTDGQNTTQYRINSGSDDYTTGMSNVWRRDSDGKLSVYHPDRGYSSSPKYYSPQDNYWYYSPVGGSSGATRLSYPDLWAQVSTDYVAYYLYARPLGQSYNTWLGRFQSTTGSSTKDSRLSSVCNATKAAGITVFGIALEAPSHGQDVIRDCSSSPGHYFDVDGLEISTAFRAIASQIKQLRLTQ